MKLFPKIFGSGDETKRYLPIVAQINALEPEFEALLELWRLRRELLVRQRLELGFKRVDLRNDGQISLRLVAGAEDLGEELHVRFLSCTFSPF